MDLSWHALNSMLQVKTLYDTEKKIPVAPTKTLQRTTRPHQNTAMTLEQLGR